MKLKTISNCENDTIEIAQNFAQELSGNEIILLYGELGAGKTLFVKSVAKKLKCHDEITSPTFTLMQTYQGKFNIYHFDLYRIKNILELDNIGFFDYIEKDGIKFIEWPEIIKDTIIGLNFIEIFIKKLDNTKREIIIKKGD